jgi:hypothetical protein
MGWRQGTTARPPTAQRSRLNRTLSLPQSGRLVLGANLNCSESRRWAACPSCASTRTRIAHGERLDCHSTGTEDAASAMMRRQTAATIAASCVRSQPCVSVRSSCRPNRASGTTAGLLVRRPPRVELESRLGCGSGPHADVPACVLTSRRAVSALSKRTSSRHRRMTDFVTRSRHAA